MRSAIVSKRLIGAAKRIAPLILALCSCTKPSGSKQDDESTTVAADPAAGSETPSTTDGPHIAGTVALEQGADPAEDSPCGGPLGRRKRSGGHFKLAMSVSLRRVYSALVAPSAAAIDWRAAAMAPALSPALARMRALW